jgi:hypothetical protein
MLLLVSTTLLTKKMRLMGERDVEIKDKGDKASTAMTTTRWTTGTTNAYVAME